MLNPDPAPTDLITVTRSRALVAATAAVVAIGWLVAQSWWTHTAAWAVHRYDVAFRARLDAATLATFPPLAEPGLRDSITQSVDFSLPFVAVLLLGTALALAGQRWWALGTVVALNLAAVPDVAPLGGALLLPPTAALDAPALPLWWPWNEIALDTAVALLPVLVAVIVRAPRTTPVVATGTALRRAGIAAVLVVLLGWVFSPPQADGSAVLHSALVVLVVLATGLVAAQERTSLPWVAVLVGLLAFRLLVGDRGTGDAVVLVAGPVAVLATPWGARTWIRLFRSGAVSTG